ncbi:helix-turn-helix domain-containing protein [Paenibacillus sp. TAB 01]|uniref:helix-turn-helix domain-containing protein n=1 Tax=Paenibacillus sp. TAB 01 TaxID=3368988 RepID=UPI003750B0B8
MSGKNFGEFLKEVRKRYGYKTQKQLADSSGISQTTLSRIEAGIQRPQPETLRILAEHLRPYTYGELMEEAGYFEGLPSEDKEFVMDLFSESETYELDRNISIIIDKMTTNNSFDAVTLTFLKTELTPLFESEGWDDIEFDPAHIKQLIIELDSNIEYKKLIHNALLRAMNLLQNHKGKKDILSETKAPYYAINKKDERDIARDLERLMNGLDGKHAIGFYGEDMELDEEERELLKASMEQTMRLAKQLAKKKFTPKKYRKE